jgi:hypothetical protein
MPWCLLLGNDFLFAYRVELLVARIFNDALRGYCTVSVSRFFCKTMEFMSRAILEIERSSEADCLGKEIITRVTDSVLRL